MSDTPAPESGVVEAVIISGTCKGQIVRLNESGEVSFSDEELSLLSRALNELDAALAGLVKSTKRVERRLHSAVYHAQLWTGNRVAPK